MKESMRTLSPLCTEGLGESWKQKNESVKNRREQNIQNHLLSLFSQEELQDVLLRHVLLLWNERRFYSKYLFLDGLK